MSIFYYLACDRCTVVSRVIGGRSFPDRWWSNDEGELEAFLQDHASCAPNPVLVSEHDDARMAYEEMPARA